MAEEKIQNPQAQDQGVFDIDATSVEFQPVAIKFRGELYYLGEEAVGVMEACEIYSVLAGEKDDPSSSELMAALPGMLAKLCPTLPLEDLRTGEQLALVQATTEVLRRLGGLNFPTPDE